MQHAPRQTAMIRVFDAYTQAEQARNALLAEGFTGERVQLVVRDDEAGPVEGNFTVGNEPIESQHHTYDRNYALPTQRGHCMLTVEESNPSLVALAEAILARFGARDPEAGLPGH